jgi:hypothetical protein
MTSTDGLRQQIADALDPDDDRSPLYGMEWLVPRVCDAVLPVVTAWAEQQARQRAAEELRAAAQQIKGDGRGGWDAAMRILYATEHLHDRADALTAGDPA